MKLMNEKTKKLRTHFLVYGVIGFSTDELVVGAV